MIEFSCHCKHRFALDDGMAGGVVQCPVCGRLVDVPTLNDLPHLEPDGTYVLNGRRVAVEKDRLAKLQRAFTRKTTDDHGQDIDLRPTLEDLERIDTPGQAPSAPVHDEARSRLAPKYDPVSGNLIVPLAVAPPPGSSANAAWPVAGRPVVTYADSDPQQAGGLWHIVLELFMPVNAIVIFFVFLAQALAQLLCFTLVVPLLVLLATAAHYVNTIEETGPEGCDELPRMMRNASFFDDVWLPAWQGLIALGICYAPVVLFIELFAYAHQTLYIQLAGAALLLGGYFLPAVALTLVTSGSAIPNLRPDRLLGLIRTCGAGYNLSVFLWYLASGLYLYTMFSPWLAEAVAQRHRWGTLLDHYAIVLPLVYVAIHAMHLFCWHLGLLYRRRHDRFPWVLQRHVATNPTATAYQRARRVLPPPATSPPPTPPPPPTAAL